MADGDLEYLPFVTGGRFTLGRHLRHDPASREYPARRVGPRAARRDRRWRNLSRRKLYQGDVGACTGFTGAQALNSLPHKAKGSRLLTNEDGFSFYAGATGRDPWAGTWPPDDTGSSGLAVALELRARALITGFEHAFGYEHGVAALAYAPLMQGTVWTEAMFRPDPDGRARIDGAEVGGHEYLWLGLQVGSTPADDRSWFLNHWEDEAAGDYWGTDARGRQGPGGGYFYLTRADHEELLGRNGDLIRLVTA